MIDQHDGATLAKEYGSLLPPHTATYVYGLAAHSERGLKLPGADERPCEGAKYHSPRPLFVEATWLVRREWWPEDAEHAHWVMAPDAWLCGTCRDNLNILLQMLHHTDGTLDWKVRREFGNEIRALAKKGWAWFEEHQSAGRV